MYMNIWNPLDREVLVCTRETDNPHDSYSAFIMLNLYAVGHISLSLSKPFSNILLLPGSTILYTVTGQKINCGSGLGLEISVMYQTKEHEKALQWLEKVINKIQADDLANTFKG